MEIKINNDLRKVLLNATKVSDIVVLEGNNGQVSVLSTNNSILFKGFLSVPECGNVKITLGKKAIELIKMIDVTEVVTVTKNEKNIEITGGTTKANLPLEDEVQFEELDMNLDKGNLFNINNAKKVLYAVGTGVSSQPALNCVRFSINDGKCSFGASDCVRVSSIYEDLLPLEGIEPLDDMEILISRNDFQKITSIISGNIAVGYIKESNKLILIGGSTAIVVKAINEKPLNYDIFNRQIKGYEKSFLVDKDELVKGIQKTLLFDNTVCLDIRTNEIVVSAVEKNSNVESEIRITGTGTNESAKIYLNAKYALDLINNSSFEEEVNVYFKDGMSLIGTISDEFINILTPIRPSSVEKN